MKRAIIAVAAVIIFAAGAKAQDVFFAFKAAPAVDIVLSAQPCGGVGLKGAVSLMVYDGGAWVGYTCNDDRVILRRYFNPNDNARTPQPVFVVQNPNAPVPVNLPVCPVGFVVTLDGQGCVPPSHPLARK